MLLLWFVSDISAISYHQRVVSELAKVLMSERMPQAAADEAAPEPLPDLVQCSTKIDDSPQKIFCREGVEEPWPQGNEATTKRVSKKTATKVLKEFMKCNLSLLEDESR